MLKRLIASSLLTAALCLPAMAQQSGQTNEGFDFDTLAACSIIYQRAAELYQEQGDAQQATDLQNTAYAYSSSAFYMLQYETRDQGVAFEYSEERMKLVVESLNESSRTSDDGDLAVITEWLPFCDTLGPGVGELINRRTDEGW